MTKKSTRSANLSVKTSTKGETKQKRILYIITKSVWGGAAKYVYDLTIHLPKNEFAVSAAAGGRGKFAQRIIESRLPYFEIKNFQRNINPLKDIFAFFEILILLFKIKPDIIHVNSPKAGGIAGPASLLYKILYKIHTIYTPHGWAFTEDRPEWQIFFIKFFSKFTCLFYDKIICVSGYDKQIALKYKTAPPNKIAAIHNGIDIKQNFFFAKKEAREKLLAACRLPLAASIIIGTIAEWTKNKGLFYLLEAIKNNSALKQFDFILIGSGENPDGKRLFAFVKKYQLKNVHLIEWIPDAASYLRAFDIFVLPSIKEGLPYTILEAMMAETPIIATKAGGIPEMIENNINGILISSKNSHELALKIIYLINNQEIGREMAKRARKKAEKEFSLEKMIKRTKNIYRSCLNFPAKTS